MLVSPAGPSLLGLPADVLRHHVLHQRCGLDRCMQLLSRQVCRRLAQLVPARRPRRPQEQEEMAAEVEEEAGVLELAALHGHVRLLEIFLPSELSRDATSLSSSSCSSSSHQPRRRLFASLAKAAAKGGHVAVLEWLQGRGLWALEASKPTPLTSVAAAAGHTALLRWLREQPGYVYAPGVFEGPIYQAARGGHRAALELLFSWSNVPRDEQACMGAARGGHLELLRWAHLHAACPWSSRTAAAAAAGGHLELLQEITKGGRREDGGHAGGEEEGGACTLDEWAPYDAAHAGHLHVLQWLLDAADCPMPSGEEEEEGEPQQEDEGGGAREDSRGPAVLFTAAAAGGQLDVLAWLRGRFPSSRPASRALFFAADAGRASALEWLMRAYPASCRPTAQACAAAARGGHLAALKRLREAGAPWDENTLLRALEAPHLPLLQWALREGCPRRSPFLLAAAARLSTYPGQACEVMGLLLEAGCPMGEAACCAAAHAGNLPALQWLHARGCPWAADTCRDAAGRLEVLQWARGNGCPWDERVFSAALRKRQGKVIAWAWRAGCPRPRDPAAYALLLHTLRQECAEEEEGGAARWEEVEEEGEQGGQGGLQQPMRRQRQA